MSPGRGHSESAAKPGKPAISRSEEPQTGAPSPRHETDLNFAELCPQKVVTLGFYLTESVYQAVSQKSIPAQIRQFLLYFRNNQGQNDRFMRKLTFATRLYELFLLDMVGEYGDGDFEVAAGAARQRRQVEYVTYYPTGVSRP